MKPRQVIATSILFLTVLAMVAAAALSSVPAPAP